MIAPPTGRPAGPPPAPIFATTGNARADSVLATLDATVAPFMQAPPAEQGAAGWVAQGLGGALGVVNAPMMFIDAAASQGVSMVLDALGLSGLFPPMPVATIGLSMHLGTPHTHVHPPSLIPPAPPVPLPSMGVAFLAGSASVLVGGVPALRAGDIGIGFTCGSLAPPFEIMTGASGVYFAGARVARFGMDITFHCNPSPPMGAFAKAMGVAGVVAGAAGAAAQASAGNAGAAIAQGIQAGLDAAAMAVAMLRGKDPAGPPGVGMLLGPPMGNVMAGGPPIPNVGALAQGKIYSALGRALKSMRGAMRRRNAPPDANGRTCDGGEPVHVVTGENYNTHLDFASLFGGFEWNRFTTSAKCFERGVLGWGWKHAFQTQLQLRLHRVTLEGFQGEEIVFPRLSGTEEVSMHGYRLKRLTDDRYEVTHRRIGTMEFARGRRGSAVARLVRVRTDKATVELAYDTHQRVEQITEHGHVLGGGSASYTVRYDGHGQLAEVWGSKFGEPPAMLVRYHYDASGDLVRAEDPAAICDAYEYDALHRMVRATDRIGYTFTWEYDHEGRCIETQGEDGLWYAAFEYEPGTTKMTIHDGSAYVYVYDEDGVITSVTGPCGTEKQRLRDFSGRVLAEVDGDHRTDFVYDGDGGLVARRNRFGHLIPPSLDKPGVPRTLIRRLPETARGFVFGDALTADDGGPKVVERKRDRLGKVTYERDDRGGERRWVYDAAGNEIRYSDRDGRTHHTQVERWGLVGARIDPLGHATRFAYTPHQKIARAVDAGGSESRYVYDSHDRVIEVHRHGGLRERYEWDLSHSLIGKYDAAGEQLLRIEPHENGMAGRVDRLDGGFCEYDYDERGRATSVETAEHRVQRCWSADDRDATEIIDGRVVRHERRTGGRTKTSVAARFISWRHRVGDRLVIVDPTGRERIVEQRADGTVEIDHGNGTVEVQDYDADGRLRGRSATVEVAGASERRPWEVRSQYSAEGDLLSTVDTVRGERKYEVDAAHRLTGAVGGRGVELSYRYDAAGNLTEISSVGDLALDTGNRLKRAGIETFDYDARQRLCRRVGLADSETRYHYNADEQLVRVDDGADEAWTATYDGLGRRVTYGRGEARTRIWWDGDRPAARESADGLFRIYVYADCGSFVPLGFVDYDSIDDEPESGRSYAVFCNEVGLPEHIEDERGKIVWWSDHATPYGEVFVRPGNAIEYDLRFPGHIYDPDLGLHYNRYRDYDPGLGRYLQPDPLGIRGGVNLYAYPSNPTVAVDVLGLSHPTPRDGDAPPSEDGDAPPRAEDPNGGDDAPPPPDDPTAFPGLRRGGEPADTHAGRVADVIADLQDPAARRRIAGEQYDAATEAKVAKERARHRNSDNADAAEQKIRDKRAANREDGVTRAERQLPRTTDGSATVITHDDGHASVGVSGGKNRRASEGVVNELNRRHPTPEGEPDTYGTTPNRVDNDGLVDAGPPNPTPGNCSEPMAAQAAREHQAATGSEPDGFQTVWAGDPAGNGHSRNGETLPGRPHQTMHPCATCQANRDNYL